MIAHLISSTRVWVGLAFLAVPNIPDQLMYMMLFLALFSDYADGKVARLLGSDGGIGQIIDPLCDALFLGCLMIFAHHHHGLPLWYLFFVMGRYALISSCSMIIMYLKKITLAATYEGKASICMNFFTVSFFILTTGYTQFGYALLIISTAMMSYSLMSYGKRLFTIATATIENQQTSTATPSLQRD